MAHTVTRKKDRNTAGGSKVARRRAALRAADTSLRLEDLRVSPTVKAISEKWARGEIDAAELMARTKAQALAEIGH